LTWPRAALAEPPWRCWEILRFGWREFLANNPPRVIAVTTGSRAVFQTLFFTLLGQLAGGADHKRYAFVGATAVVMCIMTTVCIADVPALDKWQGTFWRLRSAQVPPFVVFAIRALPYPAAGVVLATVAVLVAGPLAGLPRLTIDLLPQLPLYGLMAATSAAAGLAAGALAVGKRADVLVGNLLSYTILLTSGAFLPPDRIAWLDPLGQVLPMTHGLAAVHQALEGRPWAGSALAEAAVGAGWAALAWAVVTVQVQRARRTGHDDFN
jgi:ABC-type multidrug transport system permease subunit